MAATRRPLVSFVMATHNRREVVVETLRHLRNCGLENEDFEIIVVDNDSTDGTPEAIQSLSDVVLRLQHNDGSCSKAHGVGHAAGLFIVFLDDDSRPRPGSIERMLEHFQQRGRLGAAGFRVHLPNGREEASALPGVFHGCGVGFRAEALRQVGNLDVSFFMQAEEYDLSFRLVNAGWETHIFDDLHVDHLKTPQARRSERTTYYDTRNNLRLAARYLFAEAYRAYREDWTLRYQWLAARSVHEEAFQRGRRDGKRQALVERWSYRSRRLKPDAFEHFFRWNEIMTRMRELADAAVRRVLLADFGKNAFAFHRAALAAGIEPMAIADDVFSAPLRLYRGIPVLPLDHALSLEPDAIVVSNTASTFAEATVRKVAARTSRPVHAWFAPAAEPAVASSNGGVP